MRDLAYWKARLVDCQLMRKDHKKVYDELLSKYRRLLREDEMAIKFAQRHINEIEDKILCRKEI